MNTFSGLWYCIEGQEGAECLVLLHGLFETSRNWEPVIPYLSKRFQLLMPDLPGHGGSVPARHCCGPEDVALCLRQLLLDLDLKTVHLMGFSMGGRISFIFAGMFPFMVKSLVIEDIGPESRPEAYKIFSEFFSRYTGIFQNYEEARQIYDKIRQNRESNPLGSYFLDTLVCSNKGLWKWNFDTGIALKLLGAVSRHDYWDDLKRISCPTLILRASGSKNLSREEARKMASMINGSFYKEIGNAVHEIHREAKQSFMEEVAFFYSSENVSSLTFALEKF
jgi:2-succinyl-6-hydroxy-2,4-cyclohexadiene-1-carboxylate synthase